MCDLRFSNADAAAVGERVQVQVQQQARLREELMLIK